MKNKQQRLSIEERLARHRTPAPEDLVDRVMAALPERRNAERKKILRFPGRWWPEEGRWIAPALAGAAAALLAVLLVTRGAHPPAAGGASIAAAPARPAGAETPAAALAQTKSPASPAPATVTVRFELHAPGARRVELLGSFNDWEPGSIELHPDKSGRWTVELPLPEGRYEYIFLVDGQKWVPDPRADVHRPDGFGRVNTVLEVYDENEDDNHA